MAGGDSRANQQIDQNRQVIQGQGGQLNQNAQSQADAYQQLAAQRMGQADQAYAPALAGGGGYTAEQAAAIQDQTGLEGLRTSPDALKGNYLTDDEQAGIRGDQSGIHNALGMVDSAVDPNSVSTFTQNTRLTPEQQQQMATVAARDASQQAQAEEDANRQAAQGAGMDPLGVASYTQRANQRARQAAADASAQGRVQANQIAAQREQSILGANQTLAGQRAQAAQENLGAETGMEANASQRNAGIAANRQGVNQANQATQFNQGQYIEGQQSGRAAGVADTQRADQKEARDYLTGQIGQDTAAGLGEQGIQSGIYGTETGGLNTSTNSQIEADKKPAWWQSLLSAGAQVAAGSKYV